MSLKINTIIDGRRNNKTLCGTTSINGTVFPNLTIGEIGSTGPSGGSNDGFYSMYKCIYGVCNFENTSIGQTLFFKDITSGQDIILSSCTVYSINQSIDLSISSGVLTTILGSNTLLLDLSDTKKKNITKSYSDSLPLSVISSKLSISTDTFISTGSIYVEIYYK